MSDISVMKKTPKNSVHEPKTTQDTDAAFSAADPTPGLNDKPKV